MNNVDKNIQSIPKLLRALARSENAIENKHNIILNTAAELIEHLGEIREISKQLVKEHKSENS